MSRSITNGPSPRLGKGTAASSQELSTPPVLGSSLAALADVTSSIVEKRPPTYSAVPSDVIVRTGPSVRSTHTFEPSCAIAWRVDPPPTKTVSPTAANDRHGETPSGAQDNGSPVTGSSAATLTREDPPTMSNEPHTYRARPSAASSRSQTIDGAPELKRTSCVHTGSLVTASRATRFWEATPAAPAAGIASAKSPPTKTSLSVVTMSWTLGPSTIHVAS